LTILMWNMILHLITYRIQKHYDHDSPNYFLTMLSLVEDLIQKSFLESFHRSFHMTYCLMNLAKHLLNCTLWMKIEQWWMNFVHYKRKINQKNFINWTKYECLWKKKSIMNDNWIFMDEIHPWTKNYIK
jgi:hypothetical protein